MRQGCCLKLVGAGRSVLVSITGCSNYVGEQVQPAGELPTALENNTPASRNLRCYGNATTPLSTPALNHAANLISRHQRELRRRLLTIATSMTLLTDLESLLESFLGKYRRFEPLP